MDYYWIENITSRFPKKRLGCKERVLQVLIAMTPMLFLRGWSIGDYLAGKESFLIKNSIKTDNFWAAGRIVATWHRRLVSIRLTRGSLPSFDSNPSISVADGVSGSSESEGAIPVPTGATNELNTAGEIIFIVRCLWSMPVLNAFTTRICKIITPCRYVFSLSMGLAPFYSKKLRKYHRNALKRQCL